MNWLQRITAGFRGFGAQVRSRDFWSDLFALRTAGGATATGEAFLGSPERAMRASAVYACVGVYADSLASLPVHLYRQNGPRDVEIDRTSRIAQALATSPNTYQNAYTFFEQQQARCGLWGNCYAEIQRDRRTGEPLGLFPLDPWEVDPEIVIDRNGVPRKVFRVNGVTLQDREVLHIPALGWDGKKGMSPIRLHRESIGMSLAAVSFGADFYSRGTKLSGMLTHPAKLSNDAAARMRENWSSVYGGAANAGKVAILEEGMKFEPLTMPLEDAQYIETRKFQVSDIARIYRVPPHMIGDLEKATFSNIEHQAIQFVVHSLRPWLKRWEAEMNAKLLTPEQQGTHYFRFNVAALLRGDIKSRFEAYRIGREMGVLSVNDVRENEDLPLVDGEFGDSYLSPANMQVIGPDGAIPQPPAPNASQGAQP